MIDRQTYTDENGVEFVREIDPDTGAMSVQVDGTTVTTEQADPELLAVVRSRAATEAKKTYAQATVPQLTAASERLYGLSVLLKAQDLPADEAQAAAAQALTYVVDVLTAVCAGIADLVNTIDKDVAFRQIRADELP